MENKLGKKWQPTVGVFALIFDENGKLLVKRRGPDEKPLPGEWELPGGAIDAEEASRSLDERLVGIALAREVKEETGIDIPPIQFMPAMYPVVVRGGSDVAFAILVGVVDKKPTKGEFKYVSPYQLQLLAEGPEGNRLVSGRGKRMQRMCLRGLASRDCPNREYRIEAGAMLRLIQEESLK